MLLPKNFTIPVIAALALVSIQFAACKKKPVENPLVEVCNITHLKFSTPGSATVQDANFVYNAAGNPVSATVSSSATGNPNVIFLYDQYNRLTDYIEPYAKLDPANLPAQINFEYWIRYTYADQSPSSLPIADTSRTFGSRTNGVFFNPITTTDVDHYTYDSKGRISMFNTSLFVYDTNGNLTGTNQVYDNKKNFRSSSKILQFIDKNYSVNNPFTATTYNTDGFPTVLANATVGLLHRTMIVSSIDYACSLQAAAQ